MLWEKLLIKGGCLLGLLLSCQLALGQDYEETLLKAFRNDYRFRDMLVDSTARATEDGKYIYYVYYTNNGYVMRAEYNHRFIWTLTYVYTSFNQLPSPIRRHVNQNYGNYRITDVRYQDAPGDSYYKVDVELGSNRYQLRYMADGRFMKAKER